jgi:hypothetical protein
VLRDLPVSTQSTISILGTNKKIVWKKEGTAIKVDLNNLHPGDINASGIFVIKITDTQ